uniref:Uncharacterized protein n=1 Tax=Parastrongyloides trichosuri TaxID=131310 RepID=A0A0N4ZGZ7_PARTI
MIFIQKFIVLILLLLINYGYTQISQRERTNKNIINNINLQNLNQHNVQITHADSSFRLSNRKSPIKITSAQASNIPGLSVLRGQILPPGTIIQKRGESIRVVLPKLENPNNRLPNQPRTVVGPPLRGNNVMLPRTRQILPPNVNRGNFRPNVRQPPSKTIPQLQQPSQVQKSFNFNNNTKVQQPFINQRLINNGQFNPISMPRETTIPNKIQKFVTLPNTEHHFIHTNQIQPPAPIPPKIETSSFGNPPAEIPPNDFVVNELNRSDNFLETARHLSLSRRLRTI